MSICFRTLPCKLTSFVGQWNQILQLDRRLTRLISVSTFSQEESKISGTSTSHDKLSLTSTRCRRTLIDSENLSKRLYSTAPELSRKSIETPVESKYSQTRTGESNDKKDGPSEEDLLRVYTTLEKDLPRLFIAAMDYRIYNLDLEFINNYKGVTTKGLTAYIKQILIMRVTGHFIYAYIKFDILKMTMHPEENTVKIRWRIRGLSSYRVFFNFWKLKLTSFTESMQRMETWYDGFSTFYVGTDGKVYKHVADKMMPDDDREVIKAKTNIAAKLAT